MPDGADGPDAFAQPGALVAVEAGSRLVEQQDRGISDAGAGDRHQLALALAQLARRAVAQVRDAHVLERPGHRLPPVGVAATRARRR